MTITETVSLGPGFIKTVPHELWLTFVTLDGSERGVRRTPVRYGDPLDGLVLYRNDTAQAVTGQIYCYDKASGGSVVWRYDRVLDVPAGGSVEMAGALRVTFLNNHEPIPEGCDPDVTIG